MSNQTNVYLVDAETLHKRDAREVGLRELSRLVGPLGYMSVLRWKNRGLERAEGEDGYHCARKRSKSCSCSEANGSAAPAWTSPPSSRSTGRLGGPPDDCSVGRYLAPPPPNGRRPHRWRGLS